MPALLLTSIAFALWHVVIVTQTVRASGVLDGPFPVALGVTVSLVALFVAGVILGWLQERTGHLAAPVVVHWLAVALPRFALWSAV